MSSPVTSSSSSRDSVPTDLWCSVGLTWPHQGLKTSTGGRVVIPISGRCYGMTGDSVSIEVVDREAREAFSFTTFSTEVAMKNDKFSGSFEAAIEVRENGIGKTFLVEFDLLLKINIGCDLVPEVTKPVYAMIVVDDSEVVKDIGTGNNYKEQLSVLHRKITDTHSTYMKSMLKHNQDLLVLTTSLAANGPKMIPSVLGMSTAMNNLLASSASSGTDFSAVSSELLASVEKMTIGE